jgi:hypothetical protein
VAVSVRVDLHQAALFQFKYGPGGPIVRAASRWSQEVRAIATVIAPKDTGHLAGSSSVTVKTHPGFVVGEISFQARHALWVHEGTGIYGPRGRPIRPRVGKVMRFAAPPRLRGASKGGFVYARSVRGQRARPFLLTALRLVMQPKGAKIRTFKVRQS